MKINAFSQQNNREYQEDRFFIHEYKNKDILLGIFDGHGADFASEDACNATVKIFNHIKKNIKKNPELALTYLFERLNDLVKDYWCGSTAVIVWIKDNIAHVSVLGDSIVLINTNNRLWKSPEHNVRTNKNEADAALERGGYINNGYLFDAYKLSQSYGLQMSRSLGDKDLNRVLDRNPDIFHIPVNENSWVLLCSDGLYSLDKESPNYIEKISDLINSTENVNAEFLVKKLSETQHYDNSTAIFLEKIGKNDK